MNLQYWNNLSERERLLASIAGISLVAYLFYLLIYSPLTSSVEEKTQILVRKKETLAWMQQVSQKKISTKAPLKLSSGKLLTLISNQLHGKTFRPFVFQLQQTGQGDIQLSFEKIPYNQVMSWLWKLSQNYAIHLKQLNAERTNTPGVVKLTIVIGPS